MRPIVACAGVVVERTRAGQVTPESPGIPRAMVLRLIPRSPRRPAFLPPSLPRSLLPRNLMPASGHRDHTALPSACTRPRQSAACVHRIPPPTFVTIAKRPSVWDGTAADMMVICANIEAKYFCARGWTALWVICPPGRLAAGEKVNSSLAAIRCARTRHSSFRGVRSTSPESIITDRGYGFRACA